MADELPAFFLKVRARSGDGVPFFDVTWRHRRPDGTRTQVLRRLGPAWVEPDNEGGWKPRSGKPRDGALTERAATLAAAERVAAVEAELALEDESLSAQGGPPTFRVVARAFIEHRRTIKAVKPGYVADLEQTFLEPGTLTKRGGKVRAAHVMEALGDKRADRITTADIDRLLDARAADGVSPRTVNKLRQTLNATFNWACQRKTFGLPFNPVTESEIRAEAKSRVTTHYSVEEVEALARAMAAGLHRSPRMWKGKPYEVSEAERKAMRQEDHQDAEAVRVSAYSGLRIAELTSLRWRSVLWEDRKIRIQSNVSAGEEVDTQKGGGWTDVPMSDQALAALDRISQRPHFTGPDDYVLASRTGSRLSASALAKRAKRGMVAAGIPVLRWHDLRHTFGSLAIAGGMDLVSVKEAMSHSKISTTERYLHARSAAEQAARFTEAFNSTSRAGQPEPPPSEDSHAPPRDTSEPPDDREHSAAGS